jgi:hypothetical protein
LKQEKYINFGDTFYGYLFFVILSGKTDIDYYCEIKNRLIDNEIYGKVKEYSKKKYKVNTYFEIGRLLNEAGCKYGDNIIGE